MAERKNTKNKPNKAKKGLDTFSQKRPVGRPGRVRASEVGGRSYNLRLQFGQIWDTVGEDLIRAQTQEDVLKTLDLAGQYWRNELGSSPGILSLIVGVVRDPKFPKKIDSGKSIFWPTRWPHGAALAPGGRAISANKNEQKSERNLRTRSYARSSILNVNAVIRVLLAITLVRSAAQKSHLPWRDSGYITDAHT